MAVVTGIRGSPVFFGMAGKAGFSACVITETNFDRPFLGGKRPGMTGFAACFRLMAFMLKGNGAHFTFLAEGDGFRRGGNGFLVTQTAIAPGRCRFSLLVMAGKTGLIFRVIVKINLGRALLEGKCLGMTDFTACFQLMAFMFESNGVISLTEGDGSLR